MKKNILNLSSILVILLFAQIVHAVDIFNSCDALDALTLPVYQPGYTQEGSIVGGGNPGNCVEIITRSYNNHILRWNVAACVGQGDRISFDASNNMVLGSANVTCRIYHDGNSITPYLPAINGLTNGHIIDSAEWKSCYIDIPPEVVQIDFIEFFVSASDKIVAFDNLRLTQLYPESSNISIHNVAEDSPASVETYAAQQLQLAFQASMHVTPLINPGTPKATQIRLGLASQFSPGVGNSSEQAYVIRKPSAGLFELVGNSEPAILWAVDDFCDKVLNVSWLVNDDVIDVNGAPANLDTIQLNQIGVPDFERRGWLIGDTTDSTFYNHAIVNWMAHNRNNMKVQPVAMLLDTYSLIKRYGLDPDSSIHSFWWFVPSNEYFTSHPEYFSLINGVRTHTVPGTALEAQLCLSNPDVCDIIIQKAIDSIETYPTTKVLGIVPNDGSGGWCQCTNCLAMDKATDTITNSCGTLNAFTLPVYDPCYSQEGGILAGGGPSGGDCLWIVSRSYNNKTLVWNVSIDVETTDTFSFYLRTENAGLCIYINIYHDGLPTPYSPSITGLQNGSELIYPGWKSCSVPMTAGISHIDRIEFVCDRDNRIVDFANLVLTGINPPITNSCTTLPAFTLPVYDPCYSQEGGIAIGGGPSGGDCLWIVSRSYNNRTLVWNVSPDVNTTDTFTFDLQTGNASLSIYINIYHDGSPTPYSPSITGLLNGHDLIFPGWKSCSVPMTAGVSHIDRIEFVLDRDDRIVDFANFTLTQADGDQTGTGKYSNRLIHFCNSIADALEPNFPGVKIGTLAYSECVYPPAVNISDNVQVYYCTADRNYMKKLTDPCDVDNTVIMSRINGWLNRAKNVSLYEYYYLSGMEYCPLPYARTLCQEYSELKELGINGVFSETQSWMWPSLSLFSNVFARSAWDTSLSFQEILADYCSKRYGPAASSMASYHALYETTIYNSVPVFKMFGPASQLLPPAFTTSTLNTLEGCLTSAEATVTADGTAANIAAVASDRMMFNKFRRLKDDPAGISGIGPNLVTNPGAESDSSGWGTNTQSGNYTLSVLTSSPHSGTKSFKGSSKN